MSLQDKLDSFFSHQDGTLYRTIHEELLRVGLRAKDNNKTVLYHYGTRANGENSLAAYRTEPLCVFSFPKSYWEPRRQELNQILSYFAPVELKVPSGSPSERYSAHQILLSDETIDRIVNIIREHIAPRVGH
ncbi:hypothetical protein [Shewanella algae]|uniref:hypothetical protein n=1 Tax=Shewanella algae TaxID=38313 RepID=UPI001183B6E5|nr:hypothetical protein [Shewanella algae]MBO2672004.1 hypothetical protein [Shewanella algae]TVL31186.1 hypothetical protein AYI94_20185 [Shewanella algae]